MMAKEYDLVVIGTGTAASVAAHRVRKAGWSVAIVDFRPFGGTCALRGCDPKKVLVGAAEAHDLARRLTGKGISGELRIDWRDLVAFKRTFTDPVPARTAKGYADAGIESFCGRARFTGRESLEVEGETLEARRVLIAAGAEPVKLGIPGEEHLRTHEEFLALSELPRRLVLVGGGFIAAEFSHIAARAGAHVTVLQRGERMLTQFDPDLVGWLMESFRAVGIDVRTRTEVKSIEKTGTGFVVHVESAEDPAKFEADLVVHAAGRLPALEELALDAAGVAVEKSRLKLNEYLQSCTNEAVYAAGDAAQAGPPMTPVASHDAEVIAENLLNGNCRRPAYDGVPSVAFTIPPIAKVGLGEEEAKEKGLKPRVKCEKASDWYTARRVGEPVYGFKTLVEEESGRILGAHLVGPEADEVINIFALAIRNGLTADDLKAMIFSYPSAASDISSML